MHRFERFFSLFPNGIGLWNFPMLGIFEIFYAYNTHARTHTAHRKINEKSRFLPILVHRQQMSHIFHCMNVDVVYFTLYLQMPYQCQIFYSYFDSMWAVLSWAVRMYKHLLFLSSIHMHLTRTHSSVNTEAANEWMNKWNWINFYCSRLHTHSRSRGTTALI